MSDKKRFAVGAQVRVKNPGVNGVVTQGDEKPTTLGEYWHMIQTERGERREPGCNLELVPRPTTNSESGAPRPDRLGRELLLAEIEDVRKTMPPRETISWNTPENHKWFGDVSAAIEKWNPSKSATVKEHLDLFFSNRHARERLRGLDKLLVLLDQAGAELRLEARFDAGGLAKSADDAAASKFPDLAGGFRRMLMPKSVGAEISGEQMIRIFVSHSHADAAIAEAFADLFQSAFQLGCEAIRCSSVPRYGLQFGVEVPRQIRDEVLGASVLIGIVTESSRESAWVLFELGARWGAARVLIPVLAPNVGVDLLPPPIRDANAMTCSYENVIKLVEEIAPLLGERIPRASTYTKHIDAVLKAAGAAGGSRSQMAAGDQIIRAHQRGLPSPRSVLLNSPKVPFKGKQNADFVTEEIPRETKGFRLKVTVPHESYWRCGFVLAPEDYIHDGREDITITEHFLFQVGQGDRDPNQPTGLRFQIYHHGNSPGALPFQSESPVEVDVRFSLDRRSVSILFGDKHLEETLEPNYFRYLYILAWADQFLPFRVPVEIALI